MANIWKARTSLFARITLTFGLLVAVPLAVSGLILGLIGSTSILDSGNNMAEIGKEAVIKTRDGLVREVENNLNEVTGELSRSAQLALERASRQHVETSDRAVGEATAEIISQGRGVFKQAGQESAVVGKRAVLQAADQLRQLHRESLNILSQEFVQHTNAELQAAERQFRPGVERSITESTQAVNQEKVDALVLIARRGLIGVQEQLATAARTQTLQEFDEHEPGEATRLLQKLMKVSPGNLIPEQVICISGTGTEFLREPASPPGSPRTAWANSPELAAAKEVESIILPLRKGIGGQPVLRVVQRLQLPGEDPDFGAIIADVPLKNVAEIASRQDRRAARMLLVTADGRVLSSLDDQEVGKTIPQLKGKLLKPGQDPLKSFEIQFTDAAGERNVGQAEELDLRQPTEDDAIFGVVAQTEKQILTPVTALEKDLKGAWETALQNVGGSSKAVIDARLQKIRPDQDRIARATAADINRNISRLSDMVPAALKRSRDAILKRSGAAIARQSQQGAAETAAAIRSSRDQALQAAKLNINTMGAQEANKTLQALAKATQGEANQSAGKMSFYSGWLILLFLAMAFVLATVTTRSLVRPINRLVTATQALAAGEFSRRIRVEGEDELARLAIAFNEMAAAIEGGEAKLRQSRDSLAAQKQRIQTIVDSSPDGLVLLDTERRVSFMNPAARTMLGTPVAELPPAPFPVGRLPGDAAARLREAEEHVETVGPAAEMEIETPARRVLQYRGVTIAGEDGQHQELLLHFHDITRERQIDEMKSDFISLVSHELRTPLTSIMGFSSYLLTGKLGQVSEAQQRALESVHRQAKRLSAIISDFLDVSRIESGRVELRKEAVAVDGVARRVIADLQPQAQERSLRVRTEVADPAMGAVAMADEARVAQVFTNLLGNAYKFTEPEGSVEVLLSRRDDEVVCQVRDTGCGIPPDELDRVFDRFYQVEKVVTRKSGGTGLGLAIVKNIVEAHGGRVWIESTYGQGTQVTFTLPAA